MNEELLNLIKEDSVLPTHIHRTGGAINDASEISTVLLTGITGHLGAYILRSLLKRENVKTVYCLVRETAIKSAEKLKETLQTDRVTILSGDLSKDILGLGQEEYEQLSNEVDTILHIGVKNHHIEEYKKNEGKTSDIRTVNVLGTLKMLEFACTGKPKRLLYASTIIACNRLSEDGTLSEELIDENNFGDGITMGYVVSKFISEKLICEAIRRGLHCLIIRYSIIVGESDPGECELKPITYPKNHLFCIIASYLQTGLRPTYISAFSTVPVDICANVTLDLLFNNDVPPGIFNLANPHGGKYDDVVKVADKLGFQLMKVDFKTFSQKLREHDKKSILYPLRKLYFAEDAENIIKLQSFYLKLLLQENAGGIVNRVSPKFKKFIPDYDKIIETPNEMIYKMLISADVKSYL